MRTASLTALAFVALGCASWDTGNTARARAAEAMYCPESEVELSQVGAYRYRGEGCGRSVTVVCSSSSLQPLCLEEGELAAQTSGGEGQRPLVTTRPPEEDESSVGPDPSGSVTPDRAATTAPGEQTLPDPFTRPSAEPAPAAGDIPGPLRALLVRRAADILACVGRDVVGVRVTWDEVGAGVIGLVGELAGSDEERCVVSALADELPRNVGNPVGSGVELVRNPGADPMSDAP